MKTITRYDNKDVELEYEILAPGIYVYKNVLPKEWNLISRIENSLKKPGTRFAWRKAETGYGNVTEATRLCQDFKINHDILGKRDIYSDDLFTVHDQILDTLKTCLSHYNVENNISSIKYFECINVVKYGKGNYFKLHTDDGEPYRCTVSAVGYPNDDYVGGEITFPKFDIVYKPKAGDFLICPSTYIYIHSSEPVLDDGTKYSFVIMTDFNEFAHRKDSPTYYEKQYREQFQAYS